MWEFDQLVNRNPFLAENGVVFIDIFGAKLIDVYLQKCASFHCTNFLNVFECFNMVSVCHPLHVKWFEREMKCFAKECKLYWQQICTKDTTTTKGS